MGYTALVNGEIFFDTTVNDDRFRLTDIELNLPSSVKFTVPYTNQFYGRFHKLKDKIDIEHNGNNIFTGRVLYPTGEFNGNITIICESANAFFRDTMHHPVTYENMTNHEVFRAIVADYNDQVESSKQITVGRITVPESICYRAYENLEYTNTRLNTLAENYESRYVVKKTDTGYVVDWLASYEEGSTQKIELGSNILDIEWADDNVGIITKLIAYGSTDDDGNVVDLTTVTEGNVDYVLADQDYIDQYGIITGTKTWDDVTRPENLKTKAEAWVNATCTPVKTIKVTFVDLSDAGYDVDSIEVGQRVLCEAEPHDITGYYDCTEKNIYPLRPESNYIVLGNTILGFIESSNLQSSQQAAAVEKIYNRTIKQKTALETEIIRATKEISGNLGGNLIIHDSDGDGNPDELLIMDTDDIETAQNVWRFNKNGLAHSSTGYSGAYSLAATSDGAFVADRITTGVLNAALMKAGILQSENGGSWWNLETGELHIEGGVEYEGSKIYTTQPTPPYSVGDLYVKYFNDSAVAGMAVAGDSKVNVVPRAYMCAHGRTSGQFDETDWQFVFDYYDSYDVESRVSKAEFDIDQQAAEIRSRVSVEDFNGVEIVSEINQSATGVKIKANHLDISGKEINSIPYTEEDYQRAQQIIMGTVSATQEDLARLDFNGNGRIDAVDYIVIRKLIDDIDPDTRYWSEIKIDPTVIKETIKLEDRVGNKTRISAMAVATPNLMAERLTLGQSLFNIKEVSTNLTISGDAASQYWATGSIEVTPTSGYEIVGCSGFSIEGQSSSYKPYMMSVYKASIRKATTGKYYFDYGITNTGTNTQKIVLKYYLIEAKTKEDVNI